jgi:hypothetical protein
MQEQLDRIEAKLDALLQKSSVKKQTAAVRKKQYREKRMIRERGKIPLPDFGVLKRRDPRLRHKHPEWARRALEFGARNDLGGFLRWLVWDYNCNCYLKKPITFSGGYFRVSLGGVRNPYSEFDLMGLIKHRILLRNKADRCDFAQRPWWDWCYYIINPIYELMLEMPGFDKVNPRFAKGLCLLQGGLCSTPVEVYTELYWDRNETLNNLNRMLKQVGPLLHTCWRACVNGLRSKEDPSA